MSSTPLAPTYVTWPENRSFPPNPSVQVFFKGLLGLCFNGKIGAEIGLMSSSPQHRPHITM